MQLQLILDNIVKEKQNIKELNLIYKQKVNSLEDYKNIKKELEVLKNKKKVIENTIKNEMSLDLEKLDTEKANLESNKILSTDVVIDMIKEGKDIENIEDNKGNKYEVIIKVEFKKK